jgi:hypothetical protein
VAFVSRAPELATGDINLTDDIYLHDLGTGSTTRVSSAPDGEAGNGPSAQPSLSGDGRSVAFTSFANTLVEPDENDVADVFVRDVAAGTTRLVSERHDGSEASASSTSPSLSRDGSRVAFESAASLVPDDSDGVRDVFVRELATGTLTQVSVADDESQTAHVSEYPSLSPDGHSVAFVAQTAQLVPGAASDDEHVFVRDLRDGTTRRVSSTPTGAPGDGWSYTPVMGEAGRGVFTSTSTDLVPGDRNGQEDVFAFGPVPTRPAPPADPTPEPTPPTDPTPEPTPPTDPTPEPTPPTDPTPGPTPPVEPTPGPTPPTDPTPGPTPPADPTPGPTPPTDPTPGPTPPTDPTPGPTPPTDPTPGPTPPVEPTPGPTPPTGPTPGPTLPAEPTRPAEPAPPATPGPCSDVPPVPFTDTAGTCTSPPSPARAPAASHAA